MTRETPSEHQHPDHPEPTGPPERPPLAVRAEGADAVARLRRRAELLRRAAHPGVIELRSWHDEGTVGTLLLADPGPRRLDTHPPTDARHAAELLAAVASTVADLHAIGIAHGSLHARDIAIDDRDRPIIDGFEAAGSTLDPGAASADVVALGEVVACCVEALERPRTRTARQLRAIAEHARSGLPTAREIAADCADAAAIDERPRPLLPTVVALLAAGSALAWWNTSGDAPSATPATTIATTRATSATTVAAAPDVASPAPTTGEQPVVVHAGSTYRIGLPGDRVAVGDWRCTGQRRPAVLRPATGAVFVFDTWADASATVTVAALAHHRGATDLAARPGDACDDLVLLTPSGPVTVDIPGVGR